MAFTFKIFSDWGRQFERIKIIVKLIITGQVQFDLDGQTNGTGDLYYRGDDGELKTLSIPTNVGQKILQIANGLPDWKSAIIPITVEDFGAKGDGETNDTDAFAAAANFINQKGGGVLLEFREGATYIVGKQTTTGTFQTGVFLYQPATILKIHDCTKPVFIKGNGATVKFTNGLRFGSFNENGTPYNAPPNFYLDQYAASFGIILEIFDNDNVTIQNLNLDGNLGKAYIGGHWGDTGWQLPGDGIYIRNNNNVSITNISAYNFVRDGILVSNITPAKNSPIRYVGIFNSIFKGNTRQGLSWINGNHLYALNCEFSDTGKTINEGLGVALASAPGAGVDIEAENGYIYGGIFDGCLFSNNIGAGMVAEAGDVSDCKFTNCIFIGTTNWALWPRKPYFNFVNCKILGPLVNCYIDSGLNDPARTKFSFCDFLHDTSQFPSDFTFDIPPADTVDVTTNPENGTISPDAPDTPTVQVYTDLGAGGSPLFDHCTFDTKDQPLPWTWSAQWNHCTFKNNSTFTSFTKGLYTGINRFTFGNVGVDFYGAKFMGETYINDVQRGIDVPLYDKGIDIKYTGTSVGTFKLRVITGFDGTDLSFQSYGIRTDAYTVTPQNGDVVINPGGAPGSWLWRRVSGTWTAVL